jgi:hypothetical protein
MATALRKLTGMGGDVRKIARLLQAKAPEGHMLAYINPQEAALLKAHGGSGKPHEDTGIPSFELDEDFALQGGDTQPVTDAPAATSTSYGGDSYASADPSQYEVSAPAGGSYGLQTRPTSAGAGLTPTGPVVSPEISVPSSPKYGLDTGKALSELTAQAPQGDGLAKQLASKLGLKEETLGRLGIAGIQGLLGSRAASRAATEGQQGKTEIQALATPYQQKGQALQAQSQRGELTPQAMQSLQAAQAQAAQGVQARGGVGAAQATAQVEALRQQLLQQQYDYGLKLSGIGDNISLGAIKTGLEADKYVQQINNSFYQNMAYIAAGMTPSSTGGGR